jgi:hypothetical protein
MSSIRGETTGRKPRPAAGHEGEPPNIRGPPVAYTVKEFCAAHRISVAFYYELKREGRGPREIELNTRRIISAEAAREWRLTNTNAENTAA